MSPRSICPRTASTPASYSARLRPEWKVSVAGGALVRPSSAAPAAHEARMDIVEPARQASGVAVERPAAEPGEAGPSVEGDDPVVERQPKRWQVLIGGGDRRQALERPAEVVPEEPDEPAQEARRIGRARSASRRGDRPGCGRPRRDRVPPRATPGPRSGRRSGRSSGRCARVGRSRTGPVRAGRGTPPRCRSDAQPRSGPAAVAAGWWTWSRVDRAGGSPPG